MNVLGIDPGFGRVGWGIVKDDSRKPAVIEFGCVETDQKLNHDQRLFLIYSKIDAIIKKFHPDALAMEELFFGTNVTTAIKVGESRGVIMLSAFQNKIPLNFYKPAEVKIAVSGDGHADKKGIQRMVKMILALEQVPEPDDAADALAIALTHCFSYKLNVNR